MELLAKKAKEEMLVLVVMLVFPDCKDRKESKALMVAKERTVLPVSLVSKEIQEM